MVFASTPRHSTCLLLIAGCTAQHRPEQEEVETLKQTLGDHPARFGALVVLGRLCFGVNALGQSLQQQGPRGMQLTRASAPTITSGAARCRCCISVPFHAKKVRALITFTRFPRRCPAHERLRCPFLRHEKKKLSPRPGAPPMG